MRTVLSDAAYHIFIDQYSTDILKLLDNIEVAKFQHMNLIKNRFKKILDLALKKLIEKSDKTKSIEYAYLRLKDASGMIEYSEKKDLVEI